MFLQGNLQGFGPDRRSLLKRSFVQAEERLRSPQHLNFRLCDLSLLILTTAGLTWTSQASSKQQLRYLEAEMVPRWLLLTMVCFGCRCSPALRLQNPSSAPQQNASADSIEPTQLKVLESFVTSRKSARDGWADVGMLVDGHGKGTLISQSGITRHVGFSYVGCPGTVVTSHGEFIPVTWKGRETIIIAVFLEGVFPKPVPQHGSCTLHLLDEK
jgi:hypothetical protein